MPEASVSLATNICKSIMSVFPGRCVWLATPMLIVKAAEFGGDGSTDVNGDVGYANAEPCPIKAALTDLRI